MQRARHDQKHRLQICPECGTPSSGYTPRCQRRSYRWGWPLLVILTILGAFWGAVGASASHGSRQLSAWPRGQVPINGAYHTLLDFKGLAEGQALGDPPIADWVQASLTALGAKDAPPVSTLRSEWKAAVTVHRAVADFDPRHVMRMGPGMVRASLNITIDELKRLVQEPQGCTSFARLVVEALTHEPRISPRDDDVVVLALLEPDNGTTSTWNASWPGETIWLWTTDMKYATDVLQPVARRNWGIDFKNLDLQVTSANGTYRRAFRMQLLVDNWWMKAHAYVLSTYVLYISCLLFYSAQHLRRARAGFCLKCGYDCSVPSPR